MNMIDTSEDIKKHVAHEVMNCVAELAKKAAISKKAAYYAYLGFMPSDTSSLTEKEIMIIRKASGYKDIGRP